jgi:hypothetical protein
MSPLLKSARAFEQKVAASNFDTILNQMKQYAAGALIATKHLLSKPKYHRSTGLLTLEGQLPILTSLLQETNIGNAQRNLPRIEEVIGGMAFHTSQANTGTGYDPLTAAREEGYSAPSYYIEVLDNLSNKLTQSINQKPTSMV